MESYNDRNIEIYNSRNNGDTYKSLSTRFNISPGRCRQIYFTVKRKIDFENIKFKRAEEARAKIAAEVTDWKERNK